MPVNYELPFTRLVKFSVKGLLLGGLMFGTAYCGSTIDLDKRIKGALRVVKGPHIANNSYNPYRLSVVADEGAKGLEAYLYDRNNGKRIRITETMHTWMALNEILEVPHVKEYVDEQIEEGIAAATQSSNHEGDDEDKENEEKGTIKKIIEELW